MGLDFVELVLELEDAFGLQIPDQDAQRLLTVGDLIRYLCRRVGSQNQGPCKTSRVFFRLRQEMLGTTSLHRRDIRPQRRWEALLPAFRRRRVWRQLRAAGLHLRPLRLSRPVFTTAAVLWLVLTGVLVWKLQTCVAFVTAIPTAFVVWLLTRPLAVHPFPDESIRSSVLYLTSFKRATDSSTSLAPQAHTTKEIANKVRLIIMYNLGVSSDELRDEARFVEDLGVD